MLDIWKDDIDQSKWLKHKVEMFQYPPKMMFDISCNEEEIVSKVLTFTLHCDGIQETIYNKKSDNKIRFCAQSKWFTGDNQLSK